MVVIDYPGLMEMESPRRGGLESLTVGFMIIAFAVAMLVSYIIDDWWMFIPIFLIEAGAFWGATGLLVHPSARPQRPGLQDASYYVFWGFTLVLLGLIWIINSEYPGNGVLLLVVFLLWVGAIAMAMSLRYFRKNPQTP